MIHKWKVSALLTVLLYMGLSIQTMAQDSGWQNLIGDDLSDWQLVDGQHEFEIVDGMIVATEVEGQPNGFLCTNQQYSDFILELDIKPDIVMENSGIQFRSKFDDEFNDRLYGYQMQIENRPPHVSQWNGAIYDEKRRHWIYIIEDDPGRQKAFVQNQWNKYRIEAIGATIRTWINGISISHFVDTPVADGYEPYSANNDAKVGSSTTSGSICLQIHGALSGAAYDVRFGKQIRFRDIRVQTENLRPSPYDDIPVLNYIPNNISGQEKFQGFKLLFDGKSTAGWQGINQTQLPTSGWEINDGVLTIQGSDSEEGVGVMMTQKEYGPFELKFDYKQHDEGGIVGLKYFASPPGFVGEAGGEPLFGKMGAYPKQPDRNPRQWNSAVIKVLPNNHVQYWINGYKILDYQRDAESAARGHIRFDAYDTVSYRSIKIREL